MMQTASASVYQGGCYWPVPDDVQATSVFIRADATGPCQCLSGRMLLARASVYQGGCYWPGPVFIREDATSVTYLFKMANSKSLKSNLIYSSAKTHIDSFLVT